MMAKKKAVQIHAKKKSRTPGREKSAERNPVSDLSEAEEDLVSHMERGWRLETDSLGGNPVIRDPKNDEVIRPMSANRSTVEALQKRGLIRPGKSDEPLKIVWQLKKSKAELP
jgi:hypothetical protein